ncbi:MAG: hypothetical protein NTZ15_19270 [Burkholderiales bacterium]|nr:hypothetical protein [Burkholderiales bacterium]
MRLDSADDSASNCFEAEVFHAETRVDPNRVRVILVAGSQTQDAVVRVRSSAAVDEPVVGVVLRSLCSQKTSRRYDFLTDFPVETRSAAVPTIIAAAVTSPPAAAPSPATDAPAPVQARTPAPASRPARVRATPNPANVPQAVAAPKVEAAPKPVIAKEAPPAPKPVVKAETPDNKPHLKLEAAETPDERVVQLKPATDMVVAPEENAQKRAEAAAAWRELNHLPADKPEEKQRLLSLEAESKALKALLAKNEADFKLRLERLENSRSDDGLVYTLAGLLAAAVAAAGFFWNRGRKSPRSGGGTDWAHHGELSAEEVEHLATPSRAAPLTVQPPPNTLPGANQDTEVDESLVADLQRLNAMTAPPVPPVQAPTLRQRVTSEPVRGQYPEDFLDVQQHAEFFVSLGQYDQAIEVLRKNVDENIEVNPLAYLELLKIFHSLGRKSEFNHQRDAFNRIFNGHVPAFESYADEGRALEAYPAILRSIETLWESPKVLDFIESCLFRDPAAAPIKPFDLAAYRELLLLYAMAKSVVRKGVAPLAVDGVSSERGGRISGRQQLEPGLKSSMVDGEAGLRETTFTQPMLLMQESAVATLDDVPDDTEEAAVEKAPVDLDLDLDLDLDFSNSELAAMEQLPVAPDTQEPQEPQDSALPSLDFVIDDEPAPTLPPPLVAPTPAAPNSHLLEFDLFDPQVEAKIAPKNK